MREPVSDLDRLFEALIRIGASIKRNGFHATIAYQRGQAPLIRNARPFKYLEQTLVLTKLAQDSAVRGSNC
jgi:hypothetical protein